MKQLLFRMISEIGFMTIAAVIFVCCCVNRKKLISMLDTKEDMVLKIICGVGLIWLFWTGVKPICLDIPLYIKNDFEVIEGTVQETSNRRGVNKRISVVDVQGEIVRVDVSYMPVIEKDDEVVVKYLKHSRYGILLKRNGKDISY